MPDPWRVLVTGSRDWSDYLAVENALHDAYFSRCSDDMSLRMVVVHGAARGADSMAAQVVTMMAETGFPITAEPHAADWDAPCRPECRLGHRRPKRDGSGSYCPAAGDYRNIKMAESGINLVLAFLADCSKPNCPQRKPHPSHGASHCAGYAEEAGIPVWRYTPDG